MSVNIVITGDTGFVLNTTGQVALGIVLLTQTFIINQDSAAVVRNPTVIDLRDKK